MASWGNPSKPDCCTWKGVSCNNYSGHVIGLHLNGAPYNTICLDCPVISPSLGELRRLQYLDLSSNYFYGMVIPSSIGSLLNLIHLDLSNSGFSGNIPHQLGNSTHLTSLDLSYNYGLSAKSLNWLSKLTSLKDINLGGTNLSMAKDWFRVIGCLPLLEVLKMDYCQLFTPPSSSSFLHSANIRVISLFGNDFNCFSSFQWLFNTSNNSSVQQQSLEYLDLSNNLLQGVIPNAIGNLEFLTYLDLSQNLLASMIPDAIKNLQSLVHMDLSYNLLSGSIPSAIGDSHSILQIDLSNNHLQGPVPSSLGGASSLSHLDLSNNHLEGTIPPSLGNLYLGYLDLSSNNLSGEIPCKFGIRKFLPAYVNLSYNNFSSSLPKYFSNFVFESTEDFQGNPNLHTDELHGICEEGLGLSNQEQVVGDGGDDDDEIYLGLYVSIAIGIYTGFWAFCGTLTVKNSWRHAYFGFLDHIIDKIYVTVAVYFAKFRRNFQE